MLALLGAGCALVPLFGAGAAVVSEAAIPHSLGPPLLFSDGPSQPSSCCFNSASDNISLIKISTTAERSVGGGSPDFALEHLVGEPEASQLYRSERDADAIELLEQLQALSHRPELNVSDAIVIEQLTSEYGVGSTVHSLVYPVIQSLIENRTLFAPHLSIWAPIECRAQDLSCYFASLPSLSDYTLGPQNTTIVRRPRPFATTTPSSSRHGRASKTVQLLNANGVNDAASSDTTWERIESSNRSDHSALAQQFRDMRARGHLYPKMLDLNSHYFDSVDEDDIFSHLDSRFLRHGRFWLISQVVVLRLF